MRPSPHLNNDVSYLWNQIGCVIDGRLSGSHREEVDSDYTAEKRQIQRASTEPCHRKGGGIPGGTRITQENVEVP